MKSCDVHRLAVSFWSCVSFIGLVSYILFTYIISTTDFMQGVSLVVFAPTLLDIAHELDVGVGILSVIFLVRAIGSLIGTVGSGILMDRFPQLQYTQLCFVLVGGVASMCCACKMGTIMKHWTLYAKWSLVEQKHTNVILNSPLNP